jgi:hypothetical protein
MPPDEQRGGTTVSDESENPYAAPTAASVLPDPYSGLQIPQADRKKLNAVIKDANQFWLAILLCFLCSALGLVLIGPWYLVRLMQWRSLGRTYPILLQADPIVGSVPQKFQSARLRLTLGLIFGSVMVFLMLFLLGVSVMA